MKRLLLIAGCLLFFLIGAPSSKAQTNTFCASNLSCTLTGAWSFTAPVTTTGTTLNSVFTCPTAGANFAANITAGLALVPAGGGVLDCRNLTGTQSMAADVIFTGPVTLMLGNVNLSGTGRFIDPQGINNVTIYGMPNFPVLNVGGTSFNYTGTDWAIKSGTSAGATNRFSVYYMNVTLGASAVGGVLNVRTTFSTFDHVTLIGVAGNNTQVCFQSDGSSGFSADIQVIFPIFTQCHTAVNMLGSTGQNDANQFIGGTLQASGKADTGSTCYNKNGGDSDAVIAVDLEACDIGMQYGATTARNIATAVRFEGSTINTHVKFITGSAYNKVQTILSVGNSSSIVVSNSCGITCSVDTVGSFGSDGSANNNIYQYNNSDSSEFLTQVAGVTANQQTGIRWYDHNISAQGSLYQDASLNLFLDTGNQTIHHFAARPGVSTDINAPTGFPIRMSVNSGSGVVQLWNSAQSFHGDLTPTITANRTWTMPDFSPATMTGTVANGTATMTAGAITAATCQAAITVASANVATTDNINWAYATAPTLTTDALLHISPYVTSGNVNFTRCNPTNASITGTAIVINWRVVR